MNHTPTPVIPRLTVEGKGRIAADGWAGSFAEVFGEDDALTHAVVDRLNTHDELVAALESVRDWMPNTDKLSAAELVREYQRIARAALAKVKPQKVAA